MSHTSTWKENKPSSPDLWHPTFPCSLTGTELEFTSNHQTPTPMVAWVNLTKEEFQQWKINPEVGQTIMDFNITQEDTFF